jgi:hypothetical protein
MKEAEDRFAFWRGHWQAWAESGLSQRAYCARYRLSYAAFGYWRKRVNAAPAAPMPAFVPAVIEPSEAAAAPPEALAPTSPVSEAGIAIRLAPGRTIVVAPDFDEAVLARVIRVLEQTSC